MKFSRVSAISLHAVSFIGSRLVCTTTCCSSGFCGAAAPTPLLLHSDIVNVRQLRQAVLDKNLLSSSDLYPVKANAECTQCVLLKKRFNQFRAEDLRFQYFKVSRKDPIPKKASAKFS